MYNTTISVCQLWLHLIFNFNNLVFAGNIQRPSDDLLVSALCVVDAKVQEEASAQVKSYVNSSKLSVICGVSLRCTKSCQRSSGSKPQTLTPDSNRTVQLMNEVNETVSSELCSSQLLITDESRYLSNSEFHLPESRLVPYIVVVSLAEKSTSIPQGQLPSPLKKSISPSSKAGTIKEEGNLQFSSLLANNTDDWSIPLEWDQDPDCAIVGFTPAPAKKANNSFGGTISNDMKHTNGLNLFFDAIDSSAPHPLTPPKPPSFSFASTSDSSGTSVSTLSGSPKKNESGVPSSPVVSGNVVQCLELPPPFQREHLEILSINPSLGKQHVIVVVSTKVSFLDSCSPPDSSSVQHDSCIQHPQASQPPGVTSNPDPSTSSSFSTITTTPTPLTSQNTGACTISAPCGTASLPADAKLGPDSKVATNTHSTSSSTSTLSPSSSSDSYCGGGILVYRLKNDGVLEETPMVFMTVTSPQDVITSMLQLPMEIEDQVSTSWIVTVNCDVDNKYSLLSILVYLKLLWCSNHLIQI